MNPAQMKNIREALGYSQREMAQKLGYKTGTTIYLFERDADHVPPSDVPDLLRKMIDARIELLTSLRP